MIILKQGWWFFVKAYVNDLKILKDVFFPPFNGDSKAISMAFTINFMRPMVFQHLRGLGRRPPREETGADG